MAMPVLLCIRSVSIKTASWRRLSSTEDKKASRPERRNRLPGRSRRSSCSFISFKNRGLLSLHHTSSFHSKGRFARNSKTCSKNSIACLPCFSCPKNTVKGREPKFLLYGRSCCHISPKRVSLLHRQTIREGDNPAARAVSVRSYVSGIFAEVTAPLFSDHHKMRAAGHHNDGLRLIHLFRTSIPLGFASFSYEQERFPAAFSSGAGPRCRKIDKGTPLCYPV